MKINKARMEAFSDGIMGIIITLRIFNIPTPTSMDVAGMSDLIINLCIFFVGFVVVGSQWVKHYFLFNHYEEVSITVIWRNLLFLSILALEPFFTMWIIENPDKRIPTIAYDILFLLVLLSFEFLKSAIMKENGEEHTYLERTDQKKFWIMVLAYVVVVAGVICVSFVYPRVSIIFFVLIPIVQALTNLWGEHKIR